MPCPRWWAVGGRPRGASAADDRAAAAAAGAREFVVVTGVALLVVGLLWLRRGLLHAEHRARTDALTGLPTRQALVESGGEVFAGATTDRPVALLLVDLGTLLYDESFDRDSVDRLQSVAELRRALDRGEFVLHYQPKLTLPDRRIEGVEAMLQWQHPTRGLPPPAESSRCWSRPG